MSDPYVDVRAAIKQLFKSQGIAATIRIDDMYAAQGFDEILSECTLLDPGKLSALPHVGDLSRDDANWSDLFREKWDKLDRQQQEELQDAIRGFTDAYVAPDRQKAHVLEDLFSESSFTKLSFSEWQRVMPTMRKRDSTSRSLILFDQDMTYDGGTEEEGTRQIRTLVSDHEYDHIICCLLTHKATPGDEENYCETYSRDNSIPRDRLMVISNERLQNDQFGFVHLLKLTIMAPRFKELLDRTIGVLQASLLQAQEQLEGLSNYDLDFVVFRHSKEEGVWEPDTLIRLFSLYLRKHTILNSQKDPEIMRVADEVRVLSSILTKSTMQPEHKQAKEIQRLEIYEEAEILNELHLPIDLGDIFEKTTSGRSFILIAQPCDLMVRPEGSRRSHEGVLAEIRSATQTELDREPTRFFKLPYYAGTTDLRYFVDLRSTNAVSFDVLDLCVYNKDGKASISVDNSSAKLAVPGWNRRYELLVKDVGKILSRHKELSIAKDKKDILELLLPPSSNARLFRPTVTAVGKTLQYDCRRKMRLTPPRSVGLLSAFSAYLARPAFERDIGEPLMT